jgi:hypothetical protein
LCFVHLVKRHKIPHLDSAAEESAASLTKFGMTKVYCIEEMDGASPLPTIFVAEKETSYRVASEVETRYADGMPRLNVEIVPSGAEECA